MLKFFRRIRQEYYIGKKNRGYFLYAIGEVCLVVIGILIALQINNWNENHKERKLEDENLHKIRLNIEEDINKYNYILAAQQNYRIGVDSFLQIIRNPHKYETSDLDAYYSKLWRFERFTTSKDAINNLISSGKINIIQNEELLIDIQNYYRSIDEHLASVDEAISVYTRNQIGPYFMNFDFMDAKAIISENRQRKPLMEYHKDSAMENLLSARLFMMDIRKNWYGRQIKSAEKLLSQIDKELEK